MDEDVVDLEVLVEGLNRINQVDYFHQLNAALLRLLSNTPTDCIATNQYRLFS